MERSWISAGDFIDLKYKLGQKGGIDLLSRLSLSGQNRTVNKWNNVTPGSDFWIIPEVRKRWNEKCTGNPDKAYEDYLVENYLMNVSNLRLLSIGCGAGARERSFGKYENFYLIEGIDIARTKIEEARKNALEAGLTNIQYHVTDFWTFQSVTEHYDIILFNSSLHHFKRIDELIRKKVLPIINEKGFLVVFEYVGPRRLQWTNKQLEYSNRLLTHIPEKYKIRFNSASVKKKVYRPGWLRMCCNDPSEAAESDMILPIIHKYFKTLEEKKVGWDILHCLLKDISHNFLDDNDESKSLLNWLFDREDDYLRDTGRSDAIFGVYQKIS